jgi:hypothetical protein
VSFAATHGELWIRDDAATQLVCDGRAGGVHRWRASILDADDVEERLDALIAVFSRP